MTSEEDMPIVGERRPSLSLSIYLIIWEGARESVLVFIQDTIKIIFPRCWVASRTPYTRLSEYLRTWDLLLVYEK